MGGGGGFSYSRAGWAGPVTPLAGLTEVRDSGQKASRGGGGGCRGGSRGGAWGAIAPPPSLWLTNCLPEFPPAYDGGAA